MDKELTIEQAEIILIWLQKTINEAKTKEPWGSDNKCINAFDNDKADEINFNYIGKN